MIHKFCATSLIFAALWGGSVVSAGAAEAVKGQALHDASCLTGCHATKVAGNDTDIYTRKGHLGSLEKLKSQVAQCNRMVQGGRWQPEEEAAVVEYLRRAFYKF
ncbi:MAG: cytochrome c [Magnetococcales bacterium]|nr:cytochrome c [Magnetococcales bacterium]